MSLDNLALRTARSHVHAYSGECEELMARHAEAMDCRDCEDFLQLGIDAFRWLGRADVQYRMRVYRGVAEYDAKFEEDLAALYRLWLKPCDYALQWAEKQLRLEYRLDNLEEFKRCVEEAKALIDPNEEVTDGIAVLRDEAIEEFRAGKTSAWEA